MDGVGAISFGQQIGFRWRRPITCLSLTLLLLIELCARLASARFFVRRSLDGLTSRSVRRTGKYDRGSPQSSMLRLYGWLMAIMEWLGGGLCKTLGEEIVAWGIK